MRIGRALHIPLHQESRPPPEATLRANERAGYQSCPRLSSAVWIVVVKKNPFQVLVTETQCPSGRY